MGEFSGQRNIRSSCDHMSHLYAPDKSRSVLTASENVRIIWFKPSQSLDNSRFLLYILFGILRGQIKEHIVYVRCHIPRTRNKSRHEKVKNLHDLHVFNNTSLKFAQLYVIKMQLISYVRKSSYDHINVWNVMHLTSITLIFFVFTNDNVIT